jgi:hypothetical protein
MSKTKTKLNVDTQ